MKKYILFIVLGLFTSVCFSQVTGRLVRLEVKSKISLVKIQALRDSLQAQLPMIKNIKEREISVGTYVFEGETALDSQQIATSLKSFSFETMPIKALSVENEGRILLQF